jgi:hypothetical protein
MQKADPTFWSSFVLTMTSSAWEVLQSGLSRSETWDHHGHHNCEIDYKTNERVPYKHSNRWGCGHTNNHSGTDCDVCEVCRNRRLRLLPVSWVRSVYWSCKNKDLSSLCMQHTLHLSFRPNSAISRQEERKCENVARSTSKTGQEPRRDSILREPGSFEGAPDASASQGNEKQLCR